LILAASALLVAGDAASSDHPVVDTNKNAKIKSRAVDIDMSVPLLRMHSVMAQRL
jgi:hypothetical protein